jgi:hypothetical protein
MNPQQYAVNRSPNVISRLPNRPSGAGARGPPAQGRPRELAAYAVDNCAMQAISAQAAGRHGHNQEETLNLKQTHTYFTNAQEPPASRPMRMDSGDIVSCGSTAIGRVRQPARPTRDGDG